MSEEEKEIKHLPFKPKEEIDDNYIPDFLTDDNNNSYTDTTKSLLNPELLELLKIYKDITIRIWETEDLLDDLYSKQTETAEKINQNPHYKNAVKSIKKRSNNKSNR